MVSNDGGDGKAVHFHSLDAHAYADTDIMGAGSVVASYLQKGRSDATWIFPCWEGVLAHRAGQGLNCFALEDYGVPYGYSPVLLTHPKMLSGTHEESTRRFLAATATGYRLAASDPKLASRALCGCGHPSLSDAGFVEASATAIADKLLTPAGTWGEMELERWTSFVDFLAESRILTDRSGTPIPRDTVDVAALFTNDYLP